VPVSQRRDALARPAPTQAPTAPAPQTFQPPQPPIPQTEPPARTIAQRSSSASKRPPRPKRTAASWPVLDIVGASLLAVLAAAASAYLEPGPLRLALTLPMLLFVPGYLLLQAFVVPAATGAARGWQALASFGISPALVGTFALLTAVVEGGFRLGAIVALSLFGCLALGAAGLVRRRALANSTNAPKGNAAPKAASAAPAGTAKSGPVRP
jgi:hypothetical protein